MLPLHYKITIEGKVERSREWSSALSLHLGVVAIEKGAFGSPSTKVTNFIYISISIIINFCNHTAVCELFVLETNTWYEITMRKKKTLKKYHHHHLLVAPLARISLTLSRHPFLLFIASGVLRATYRILTELLYVGSSAFARPCEGSIWKHPLWAHPCFSSSVLHVWFV